MAERSTLNRRGTSLTEIDKICGGNKANQGASTCDHNAYSRPGQFLLFDAKITVRSGDDRGQIDTGRLPPHKESICSDFEKMSVSAVVLLKAGLKCTE